MNRIIQHLDYLWVIRKQFPDCIGLQNEYRYTLWKAIQENKVRNEFSILSIWRSWSPGSPAQLKNRHLSR